MNILRVSTLSLTLAVAAFALGFANPAFAEKVKNCDPPDPHPSCKDDGGGDGGKAKFSVFIIPGVVMSSGNSLDSHPWWTGSKHGIGEADPHEDKVALENFDASYFADTIPDGVNCFGASTSVREASIRERRGAMESMFWFHGRTNDDSEDVTYILHMGGVLDAGDFPPAPLGVISMMDMDHWRINVANGQSDVEPFACDAVSGDFPDDNPVQIDVKAET